MTWYKPTLILSRLLITKSGTTVYDENYHFGLNVIRGSNSSGKTTIARAIIYALGGDLKQWTPELSKCDFVIAEVIINQVHITLRRPIDQAQRNPMEIFWGDYERATNASPASWQIFPYANYKSKMGFSKVLFEALNLPEVKGYQETNITMHQVLRLMYGDQSSPATKILGIEDFDSTITRESIGDLLCGIYNDELFNARAELRIVETQLKSVVLNLKNFYQILGKDNTDNSNNSDIEAEIAAAISNLNLVVAENYEIKNGACIVKSSDNTNEIRDHLKDYKDKLYQQHEELESVEFAISDSEVFINELKIKVASLNDSISVAKVVNSFTYKNCPACFTDLTNIGRADDECGLCGTKLSIDTSAVNLHRMRNEIQMQIDESIKLLDYNKNKAEALKMEIVDLSIRVRILSHNYRDVATDIGSSKQLKIQENYKRIGYLERTIEDLEKKRLLMEQLKKIAEERDQLNQKKYELKEFIEQQELKQSNRKEEVAQEISDAVVNILKNDLDRQKEFSSARSVKFDFGTNSVYVDGEATFSESSTVYLKNAFLLGLLTVSTNDKLLRFPRFLLLDGIENGGMERARSHNLQKLILELSDAMKIDHQIIITTADIAPEIERTAFTVGYSYTSSDRSLRFL